MPDPDMGVFHEDPDFQAILRTWADGFRDVSPGDTLPPHSSTCVGCGPDNPHGLNMVVSRVEDGVRCDLEFDSRHVGAPGVAHGGAVAMAFDDLFGFLLYVVGELAVTRNLSVDYTRPVKLGTGYVLTASASPRNGRRIPVRASLEDVRGESVATATATFVVVDIDHFSRAASRT